MWKRLVNGESGISSTLTQKGDFLQACSIKNFCSFTCSVCFLSFLADPLYKTLPSHVGEVIAYSVVNLRGGSEICTRQCLAMWVR